MYEVNTNSFFLIAFIDICSVVYAYTPCRKPRDAQASFMK
jgi:cbb3-type cytochrome oxidase subunit 3